MKSYNIQWLNIKTLNQNKQKQKKNANTLFETEKVHKNQLFKKFKNDESL